MIADKIRKWFGTEPHDLDIPIPFRIKRCRWYIPEFNPLWWATYIVGGVIGAAFIYFMSVAMIIIAEVFR